MGLRYHRLSMQGTVTLSSGDFWPRLSTDGYQPPVRTIDSQDLHSTWHGRMFLKNIDLTTALRPSFLPDEVLFFVQDNVGLYEGCVYAFIRHI
jgi:hypothetical protein